ncbi:DNA cytosine methyltransferase [Paeniclostridium sordellii]|uniref:DNA cytosine methyltransferase n=1 Tax=Paraclostridium sordellii TaxID=1505 RepID=UPI0005DD204D|nr:DNA cytosine methyltransferase [Paeniclostridium sordellii]MCQ4696280.1 DNA cytosine methyltransferase [Paeniclostridium sordellii]CEN81848.1 DNA-cytosine methyltransferase [[Clostridium] sordellii] [Paeniclostridium sordellii]CEO08601.1 DNA-cytosine methyltransferase [[Clostridium] sordellii] [Paeniclostridium sordellii]
MHNIDLEKYSFWGRIKNIESTKDKKSFKTKIENFINTVCEVNSLDRSLDNIDNIELNDDIVDFLQRLGAINEIADISNIKNILKKDFDRLVKVSRICIDRGFEDINIKRFMNEYRALRVSQYMKDDKSPTVVDFFCGSGGLSLGFHREGYKILLANDIEEVCTHTYSFNHSEIPMDRIIHGDIKEVVKDIGSLVKENVDIVMGGPPCQGFSMANRQRIIDDPRNELYKYFVKAIEKLKPKFFVMENVKGMLSVANQVKEDFHSLDGVDYDVDYYLFNAKDFSVPQNRERLIYIGVRSDIREEKNIEALSIIEEIKEKSDNLPKYVLEDALYGLRSLDALTIKNATERDTEESGKKIDKSTEQVNDYIKLINDNKINSLTFNHKARFNNDRDIEIYGKMIPGDKSDSPRIADIMPYKSRADIFKDKYYKLKMDAVCKTITAHMKFDCNMYIHPTQARGLTPREAARVQSYPDYYFFLGAYTKTYMQVGNSVPPQMSNVFAKIIKKYII